MSEKIICVRVISERVSEYAQSQVVVLSYISNNNNNNNSSICVYHDNCSRVKYDSSNK